MNEIEDINELMILINQADQQARLEVYFNNLLDIPQEII